MRRLDRELGRKPSPWPLPAGATREELRAEQAIEAMGGDPGPLLTALVDHIARGCADTPRWSLRRVFGHTVPAQSGPAVPEKIYAITVADRALHSLPTLVRLAVVPLPGLRPLVEARRVSMICRYAETAQGHTVYPIRLLARRPDGKIEVRTISSVTRRTRDYRLRRDGNGYWRATRIRAARGD
jgi:hypothetical protein